MTAGTVKKSPVIVVKEKRQFTLSPVTENIPAAPDRGKIPSSVSESPAVSPQPQTHPSGLTKKQRKYLRHKERMRQIRRDNIRNGRQKQPLFRQVFPFLCSGLKTTSFALLRSALSKMLKPLLTKTLTADSPCRTAAAFSPWLLRHYPISVSLPPAPFVMTSTDCPPAPSLKGKSSTLSRPVNAFSVFSNKRLLKHNRTPFPGTVMRKMTESCRYGGWLRYQSGRAPFRPEHLLLRDSP